MKIVVAFKHVPSVADELEINDEGTNLDFDSTDFVLSEWDEQALEEAVLIKEASGGTVTVVGVDLIEELDRVLHSALAKGANKAAKIVGDFEPPVDSRTQAQLLAEVIGDMEADLVLTGVQAVDDLDGQMAPMLAAYLNMPYVGVVVGVEASNGTATVKKEYAGGVLAKFDVSLPMVVGIQAASQPPRYAPVSKIRQMAKSCTIEEIEFDSDDAEGLEVLKMAKPVSGQGAVMLDGDAEEVAGEIIAIIKERGLL